MDPATAGRLAGERQRGVLRGDVPVMREGSSFYMKRYDLDSNPTGAGMVESYKDAMLRNQQRRGIVFDPQLGENTPVPDAIGAMKARIDAQVGAAVAAALEATPPTVASSRAPKGAPPRQTAFNRYVGPALDQALRADAETSNRDFIASLGLFAPSVVDSPNYAGTPISVTDAIQQARRLVTEAQLTGDENAEQRAMEWVIPHAGGSSTVEELLATHEHVKQQAVKRAIESNAEQVKRDKWYEESRPRSTAREISSIASLAPGQRGFMEAGSRFDRGVFGASRGMDITDFPAGVRSLFTTDPSAAPWGFRYKSPAPAPRKNPFAIVTPSATLGVRG